MLRHWLDVPLGPWIKWNADCGKPSGVDGSIVSLFPPFEALWSPQKRSRHRTLGTGEPGFRAAGRSRPLHQEGLGIGEFASDLESPKTRWKRWKSTKIARVCC